MTTGIALLTGCVAVLLTLGVVESLRLRRHQRRIPIRIHVNGTRGKSSVTRLIAAGLREAGVRTVAKTTGTLPRLILPDGSEQPIHRSSKANVIEQRDVAAVAARMGAEALVVECMALQPHLQWLCESKFVRATHAVITNCRADHLDVMGPTEPDVARALANMTPVRGRLFTAERRHLAILRDAANDRGSTLIAVSEVEVAAVDERAMSRFSHNEHKENVALALRVCEELGVDRDTALAGMQRAEPDPGATTTHVIDFFGRSISFVGAFATNDPDSTKTVWEKSLQACPWAQRRIAIVNCRADRPDRSAQLGRAIVDWTPADHIVLTGSGASVFARAGLASGLDPRKLTYAEHCDAAELFELVVELAGRASVVVGMGNIGDHGLEIVRYFRNRSSVPQLQPEEALPSAASRLRVPSELDEFAALVGAATEANGSHDGPPAAHVNGISGKANGHVLPHVNGNSAQIPHPKD